MAKLAWPLLEATAASNGESVVGFETGLAWRGVRRCLLSRRMDGSSPSRSSQRRRPARSPGRRSKCACTRTCSRSGPAIPATRTRSFAASSGSDPNSVSPHTSPMLRAPIEVHPVIAIGRGDSDAALSDLKAVQVGSWERVSTLGAFRSFPSRWPVGSTICSTIWRFKSEACRSERARPRPPRSSILHPARWRLRNAMVEFLGTQEIRVRAMYNRTRALFAENVVAALYRTHSWCKIPPPRGMSSGRRQWTPSRSGYRSSARVSTSREWRRLPLAGNVVIPTVKEAALILTEGPSVRATTARSWSSRVTVDGRRERMGVLRPDADGRDEGEGRPTGRSRGDGREWCQPATLAETVRRVATRPPSRQTLRQDRYDLVGLRRLIKTTAAELAASRSAAA